MYTTEEILSHPLFIIFATYSFLTPFYHFKRNEEGIADTHIYAPAILKEKKGLLRKLLLWAFSGKKTQVRIYYYARKITWITLIFVSVVLLLTFIFKWYLNHTFIFLYYCFLIGWMILVEGFPVVLISIYKHIIKKAKKTK